MGFCHFDSFIAFLFLRLVWNVWLIGLEHLLDNGTNSQCWTERKRLERWSMLCHQHVLGIVLKVVHGFLWLWFLHRFLASPLNYWGVNFYDHGCYPDYCVFHSFWTWCKSPLNGESEIEFHPEIEKQMNKKSSFWQK